MVERSLDQVFGALADPTRRAILSALRRRPRSVTELAEPFPVSLNAVSKHILVLERAGLVSREVLGREHRLTLAAAPLREVDDWIAHYRQFWAARLDALEQHVLNSQAASRGRKQSK